MKNLNHSIHFVVVFALMSSCGVRFTPVTPTLSLPEAYRERSIYPGGIAIYTPEDLVGNILFIREGQQPITGGKLYPINFTPTYHPLTSDQSLNYYNSKITKGAEAEGSYLSFAASFSANEMAELEMVDIGFVNISLNAVQFDDIKKKAEAWVNSNPKDTSVPGLRRIWVKSVVLTSRRFTSSTEISANASGVATPAVKVGGKVYSTSNTSIRSVLMGFEAYDIDELGKTNIKLAAGVEPEISLKAFKSPFRVTTVVGPKDNPGLPQSQLK